MQQAVNFIHFSICQQGETAKDAGNTRDNSGDRRTMSGQLSLLLGDSVQFLLDFKAVWTKVSKNDYSRLCGSLHGSPQRSGSRTSTQRPQS